MKALKTSRADAMVIYEIVRRAAALTKLCSNVASPRRGTAWTSPIMSLWLDLLCIHSKTPLHLERFRTADDFNFIHDIEGIQNNLNRKTGKLENCFVPRYAK